MAGGNGTSMWKGLALGCLAVALITGYAHHIRHVLRVGDLVISHYPFLLFATLALLALAVRPALRRWAPRLSLGRNDLVAALVVGFVGTAIPPLVVRFVATISAPYYYATPENGWADYAFPYLPGWLFPTNDAGQMQAFYQGLTPGESIPWGAWAAPLFWWFGLIAAMLLGCVFVAVVLRRQWAERERLAYPHVQVSLALAEDPQGDAFLPRLARSRLFWIGFGISFLALAWNVAGYFSPAFPALQFIQGYPRLEPARGFPTVFTKFDFYVIGFAFFTPLEILLSIWFFHLLAVAQVGVSHRVGFGPASWDAGVNWQTAGGLAAFVVWGVWMARAQVRDAWRKAWTGGTEVDDSDELISYRTAVFGGLVCVAFILGWLCTAGMTLPVALLFAAVYLVMSLGVAKIVATAGLISLRWTWPPNSIMAGALGSEAVGMGSFAMLSITEALHCIWKGFALPAASDAARLGDELRGNRRRVGAVTVAVGIAALCLCVASLIALGYREGAQNFGDYRFTTSNRFTYNWIASAVLNPEPVKGQELGFFGFGALLTLLLTLLLYRLPWWPLHPLGSTIAFSWPIRASAFSIFVAWAQ